MNYKGYTGKVEFDSEAKLFFGRVINIKDVITFEGTTADEILQAFYDSVDDYLEFCAELGREPDKPFSGRLAYRTTPETHRKIAFAAAKLHKSVNAWMDEVLEKAAEQVLSESEGT